MRDPRRHLYLVVCAAMFAFGTLMGLPGALFALPDVVERLHLTLADRGGLIASLFVGTGIGSALSGPIAEIIGSRAMLISGCALMAACLPLVAFASGYGGVAAALVTLGVASAGINTAANVLVSDAFPDERGHRLNAISIAVALGGLAMPAAAAAIASRLPWTTLVFAAAALAAAVTVATLGIHVPATATGTRLTLAGTGQLLRQPGLSLVVLLVLLSAGNDVTMAGWTSTYLVGLGFAPDSAAWALSGYWLGLIAGRLALSRYVDRDKAAAIAAAAAACAGCVLLLVAASSAPLLAVMPFLTGAAIALLVPTSLALGGERYPANPGMTFGVLLTAAQVGGMALPALVGLVAERAGLRVAMALLVANSLLIAVAARAAARRAR